MSVRDERGRLRLGIAGCGRIVERGYLPALHGLPSVELAAVADPDRGRAGRSVEGTGAAVFASTEEMLARGGLDAVVVATPGHTHLELAGLAAAAGLPSLVEKPPGGDLVGAAGLAALDPAPTIGFNRRFLQGAALLPLLPAVGWLELELEIRFRRDGWGAHVSRDEALLDAGIHMIDLAAFLTGSEPIAVRGASVEPDRASLELELGRGRARIRCATDRPYAERITINDRAGRAPASFRTDRRRAALRRLQRKEDSLVGSLRRQLDRLAATAVGGDPGPLASARDGATAMAVVEAARHSAELDGAEVTVAGAPA